MASIRASCMVLFSLLLSKLKPINIQMKNYHLHSKLLLRTPLLAQNTYIAKILKTNDLAILKIAFQDIILQEALFLASPVLYEECIKWLRGDIAASEELHLAQGLWRYLLRMSSRCTPFGLFAGVSVGEWSNENNITLGQVADNQRNTRADMEYLGALAQHLSQQADIRAQLRFYPNNSLYESGEKLRYVDYHYEGKRRVHQIVAIDNSVYVQAVLDAARQGATPSDLTKAIVSDDISEAEALDFVHEMIASQVLISELDGKVTGSSTLSISEGKGTENTAKFTPLQFLNFVKGLQDIDNQPLGVSPEQYKALAKSLDELAVPYELNRLFQTDLEKPTLQCSLDKKIAGSLRKGLSLLNRLAVAPRETNLKKFADAFSERYETQELPLLDVLDVETGIGYLQISDTQGDINPLVDDLMVGSVGSSTQNIHWDNRQAFLFKKLSKYSLYQIND